MRTIYQAFADCVKANPTRTAIIDSQGRMTYQELSDLADKIAAEFPAGNPRRVGIVMNHGRRMIATILAVLKKGAAYLPVEPDFPPERIKFCLDQSGADLLVTDRGYHTLEPTHVPPVHSDSPLAYILYTSGTTGRPKGVMITNANLLHYVRAFSHEFHPGPGDVMLQYSVCTFDIFTEELFTTLLNGATLAIAPATARKDIDKLIKFMHKAGVTMVTGFPYLLLELDKRADKLPSTLRLLISGGDVLRLGYVEHVIDRLPVYNTYGPSETTVCASYQHCRREDALPDGTFPIGYPVQGAHIDILDDELNPVPAGQKGEICISGDGVFAGYIGNQEAEKHALVTLPDGHRLYRSGDMGIRRDDGSLLFLHRRDKQVMILGKRVEPDEVQNVLCDIDGIEAGVVRSRNDNHGLAYLTAYVVTKGRKALNIDALRRKMARLLPPYMIPEFIVQLSELPLTPNGKVDTHKLPVITKTATV